MEVSARHITLVALLFALVAMLAACTLPSLTGSARSWTPAPATTAPQALAASPTVSPTPAPTDTPRPTPTTSVPTATPRATSALARPTATRTPARSPTPTRDPHLIVVTEDDIAASVASGATAQQGVQVEDLKVRFADGKMYLTAKKLGYGALVLRDLNLVGRLVARDGRVQLEVESISPRGLMAAMVPTVANQALSQFTSKWYVEDVDVLDGRVELRIR